MLDLSPLWISLRIAAIATPIAVVLGTGAAYGLDRYRGPGRSLLDGLLLAPMVLPPTVLGFVLLLLLGRRSPLGALLERLGISVIFTWYAAVLTATIVALPLAYKTVASAIAQIDRNVQQAARTLGASEWLLLRRITLPLALPGLVAATSLAFARALGEFGATLMLAGNIPGKTQTIPMAIYFAVEAGAFREAAVWTALVGAIALTGLALSNYRPPRRRAPPETLPPARSPEIPPEIAARPSQPAGPQLELELVKSLPGFALNVAFAADRHPLGLLGASGAGKSLILRCTAGTATPDSGRIVLNGRVLFDSARGIDVPSRDRRVGVLFQNYALFPHLSAAENVAFGMPQTLSRRQRRWRAERELAAVQLQGMGDRLPGELSGGQQQRVALARVLASDPEVLLLDEPFSALDTHLHHFIERDLKLRLASFTGATILVTHNIEEAYRLCDRLLVMEQGTVAACDEKTAVMDRPETVSAARLTGCKNISRAFAIAPGVVRAVDWNCTLKVNAPGPCTHIGARAHHVRFLDCAEGGAIAPETTNIFSCWLAAASETPHRRTLYLKLGAPPTSERDYHLQAEVLAARWATLSTQPLP